MCDEEKRSTKDKQNTSLSSSNKKIILVWQHGGDYSQHFKYNEKANDNVNNNDNNNGNNNDATKQERYQSNEKDAANN